MKFYRLMKGSYSYDEKTTDENANTFTEEDVINWAKDVAQMMNSESSLESYEVADIDNAIELLESANEFLEEVKKTMEDELLNQKKFELINLIKTADNWLTAWDLIRLISEAKTIEDVEFFEKSKTMETLHLK